MRNLKDGSLKVVPSSGLGRMERYRWTGANSLASPLISFFCVRFVLLFVCFFSFSFFNFLFIYLVYLFIYLFFVLASVFLLQTYVEYNLGFFFFLNYVFSFFASFSFYCLGFYFHFFFFGLSVLAAGFM